MNRHATFDWLQKQPVRGKRKMSGGAYSQLNNTFPHLIALALYRNGAGAKAVCNRLRLPSRTYAPTVLNLVKSLNAFETGRPSPLWSNASRGTRLELSGLDNGTLEELDQTKKAERAYRNAYLRAYDFGDTTPCGNSRREIKRDLGRMNATPHLRIKFYLRKRLRKCALGKDYSLKTIDLIGCTPHKLKRHLQRQFIPGMTWTNYGRAWHIDHIVPCSSFNLLDPQEARRCFRYTNLRPLWASENISKGDRPMHVTLALADTTTHAHGNGQMTFDASVTYGPEDVAQSGTTALQHGARCDC